MLTNPNDGRGRSYLYLPETRFQKFPGKYWNFPLNFWYFPRILRFRQRMRDSPIYRGNDSCLGQLKVPLEGDGIEKTASGRPLIDGKSIPTDASVVVRDPADRWRCER